MIDHNIVIRPSQDNASSATSFHSHSLFPTLVITLSKCRPASSYGMSHVAHGERFLDLVRYVASTLHLWAARRKIPIRNIYGLIRVRSEHYPRLAALIRAKPDDAYFDAVEKCLGTTPANSSSAICPRRLWLSSRHLGKREAPSAGQDFTHR